MPFLPCFQRLHIPVRFWVTTTEGNQKYGSSCSERELLAYYIIIRSCNWKGQSKQDWHEYNCLQGLKVVQIPHPFPISQSCSPLCWLHLHWDLCTVNPCQPWVYSLLLDGIHRDPLHPEFQQSLRVSVFGEPESCAHLWTSHCGLGGGRHSLARSHGCPWPSLEPATQLSVGFHHQNHVEGKMVLQRETRAIKACITIWDAISFPPILFLESSSHGIFSHPGTKMTPLKLHACSEDLSTPILFSSVSNITQERGPPNSWAPKGTKDGTEDSLVLSIGKPGQEHRCALQAYSFW